MRIVSDFDGVLTDQTAEADRAFDIFQALMLKETSLAADDIEALLASSREALQDAPESYGWLSGARLSAFADEDLFVRSQGVALFLDQTLPDTVFCSPEIHSFQALSGVAYHQMVHETAQGVHKPFDPRAADMLRALLSAGHEVTVVSNSSTDRIMQLLQDADVPVEAASADEVQATLDQGAPVVRARGDARKFILSDSAESLGAIQVGHYTCAIDRPHYRAILLEERPDMVIGDVFSLDLALPIALASAGNIGAHGFKAVLRRRSYTPAWSQGFAPTDSIQFRVIDDIMDIVGMCR